VTVEAEVLAPVKRPRQRRLPRLPVPRPRPRIRLRPRLAAVVAGVLVVAAITAFGVQYRSARATLDRTRTQLAQAGNALAAARAERDRLDQRNGLTAASRELVLVEIDDAVAVRTLADALAANALLEVASVDAERAQTDLERLLVAAHAEETMVCFDGVAQAVDASHRGDDGAAVGALRAASTSCARTLAYATGAAFPYDFADPFVLPASGVYYGYSTNAGAGDIQVIRSTDLVTWELVGNGLAGLPAWAAPNATWAPAVAARGGRYVAYYTVRHAGSRRQCISRAVAATPAGPFVDDSAAPLVCQLALEGSIDPSPFVDADGRAYLLWKSEGLGAAAPQLWSQELSADGLALIGTPQPLLTVDREFERGVVEAPSMVRDAGTYVLTYSAANWSSRSYVAAYATCAGPRGPCTKPPDGRVLTTGDRLAGPGGVELFRAYDGALWAAFHAYSEPNVGYPSSRYLHLARARMVDGRLDIDAAT
jgi:Glycosyl hydrolases family 43